MFLLLKIFTQQIPTNNVGLVRIEKQYIGIAVYIARLYSRMYTTCTKYENNRNSLISSVHCLTESTNDYQHWQFKLAKTQTEQTNKINKLKQIKQTNTFFEKFIIKFVGRKLKLYFAI